MLKRLVAWSTCAVSIFALPADGVAQQLLNQEYLKQSLRAAMPPSAQCTINLAGPACSYQDSNGKLDARMNAYDLVLTLSFTTLNDQVSELERTLFQFAEKYGFLKESVEVCLHDGFEKLKAGKARSIVWSPENSGQVVNKNIRILCHAEKSFQTNESQLAIMLGPSQSF